ncbi:bifunctional phosphoribosylaminoimidazolecarboxamide formyltransferase/IMP cyclohydrolase PurH [Helicobacter cholecystus]|uniref:Bifunctional purine biosynthesis protein PurH n=1 Tax=Helicobacter cholecystus TaxID=45498 RepID=A0A3D8IXY3_9HELI|nr:bifunctional phosphoribosylaminoimidazolecarboxamide formyltransferase/IMP cyclohydrolase [Helicobacter cholecystus]RDU70118.1 bifunctional phosphoribosylaminoimidazolecarboxamide formyltransferase/IMP cyclohydrolase PurH [Helicobacter cholecystus]VEJ24704.1 bifunctional phosphoribosylaminoimidazolecarboxamide formyltransferase/IMP cyclohydrolase [Helicobacter cholecystus]
MFALLSVSDKSGIVEFAKGLRECGYEILSTSGTLKILQENNIPALDIAMYTGVKEMFDGRVKTLNPKIAGGILYRRSMENHIKDAQENDIKPIDLLCVNLYPFKDTIERTDNFEEIIENIDIGGPSMIRAGAKNFESVLVLTDPNDYSKILKKLKHKENTLELRREMMIKAYEHTAGYDCLIANYMNERFNEGFGEHTFIMGKKVMNTRYGENPHQKGALYAQNEYFFKDFKVLKGEPSFNNFADIDSAIKIAAQFKNSACIIKHGNPCGFALKDNAFLSYISALSCDSLSAYGGVVAINAKVDLKLAQKIGETFIEVLIAPSLTSEALEFLSAKKTLKIFCMTSEMQYFSLPHSQKSFKSILGGFLLQESDSVNEEEVKEAKKMGDYEASESQKRDLEIAYKIVALTKSNCVAYVKDGALVGIGMGMTSRVDASRNAMLKAKDMRLDLRGCSLASEAFFPFKDSIELAVSMGVSAIIEPGGSIRDNEVIECANSHKIPIYFTFKRHFLH